MAGKKTSVIVHTGKTASIVALDSTAPTRIKVLPDTWYLVNTPSDVSPQKFRAARSGNDLLVTLEGDSSPALVLEGYFTQPAPSGLYGVGASGQLYAYSDVQGAPGLFALPDGGAQSLTLAGKPLGPAAPYLVASSSDNPTPYLWVLGGLAGAGVLAGLGGGGGSASPGPAPAPTPVPDTTPPNATMPVISDNVGTLTGPLVNGDRTNDATPTLSGKAEPGATVIVYDTGIKIGEAAVGPDGGWSFTPAKPLPDGVHAFTTTVVDAAGNASPRSAPLSVTVDTVAPDAPVAPAVQDNKGSIKGAVLNNGVTDDTQPVLSGKTEPGAKVEVFDNGKSIGFAVADVTGTWSLTPATPLVDGVHSITVQATDAAGNTSAVGAPLAFTVDTVAPTTPVAPGVQDNKGSIKGPVLNNGVTDETQPVLSGKTEPGAKLEVFDNGKSLGFATVDASGNWTLTPAAALMEGAHKITVQATDVAGNASAVGAAMAFTVDTIAPTTPVAPAVQDNKGTIKGPVPSNGVTDDAQPVLSGKTEPGAKLEVFDNGKSIGFATVDASGNWTLTPAAPLADGIHKVSVQATDAAGNASAIGAATTFTVDTVAPTTPGAADVQDNKGTIEGPVANGGVTDDTQPVLSGKTEPGARVEVFDNGKSIGFATVDASGNWTLTPSAPLAEGAHKITVQSTDAAGNASAAGAAVAFTVDTIAPTTPVAPGVLDNKGTIKGPVLNNGVTDDTQPVLSGKTEPGAKLEVFDNGKSIGFATVDASGNWTLTPAAPLVDGVHKITVQATDTAGNASAVGAAVAFTVDTVAPTTPVAPAAQDNKGTIKGPVLNNGVTDDAQPVLSGKTEPGAKLEVFDNGKSIGFAAVDASGNWTLTPAAPLVDGVHKITVQSTDAAGNASAAGAATSFTVDTVAPATAAAPDVQDNVGTIKGPVLNEGVTDDTQAVISGKSEVGSKVEVFDGDKSLGLATVDAHGDWTFHPAAPLAGGAHSISTQETDAAGNISLKSAATAFTIDVVAPVAAAAPSVEDHHGSITGLLSDGSVTDDNAPIFSGKGEAGSTVQVFDNGASIGVATVDSNGAWTLTPHTTLAEGQHIIATQETDVAGNTGALSGTLTLTVDTTPPVAPKLESISADGDATPITDGANTGSAMLHISGSAEDGSVVAVYDNGTLIGSSTSHANAWQIDTPALGNGPHEFTAIATDAAGNSGTASQPWHVMVDVMPPAPVVVTMEEPAVNNEGSRSAWEQATITRSPIDASESEAVPVDGEKTGSIGTLVMDGAAMEIDLSALSASQARGDAPKADVAVNTSATDSGATSSSFVMVAPQIRMDLLADEKVHSTIM